MGKFPSRSLQNLLKHLGRAKTVMLSCYRRGKLPQRRAPNPASLPQLGTIKPLGAIIDRPHNQPRGIILFGETWYSLVMSSRALAWRSHSTDIYTMRLPRRKAPRNDRLKRPTNQNLKYPTKSELSIEVQQNQENFCNSRFQESCAEIKPKTLRGLALINARFRKSVLGLTRERLRPFG